MNRNAIVGLALVGTAAVLACLCTGALGAIAEGLVGKAVWYLPYVALVIGVQRLTR